MQPQEKEADLEYLFAPVPKDVLDRLSKEDTRTLIEGLESTVKQLRKLNEKLKTEIASKQVQGILFEEKYNLLRSEMFGRSSERRKPSQNLIDAHEIEQNKKPIRDRVQLPSIRYPNLPVQIVDVVFDEIPACTGCGEKLHDSGMVEESERLSVIPKKYFIERYRRHVYDCSCCHGELKTAPSPPRIKPGSSYSDEVMVDVVVAKYDHLIPIERYARMAEDLGAEIPSQSLIETTHYTADFLKPIYEEIKKEVQSATVLHADETPHRMLEGDKKKTWYMWGFSTKRSSYFELHNTRSGNVASRFLSESACTYLVSDVYSGYKKAVSDANVFRKSEQREPIQSLYCNAHARRKFSEAEENFKDEAEYFLSRYQEVYLKEKVSKDRPPDARKRVREEIEVILYDMRDHAIESIHKFPEKSSIGKALSYFLKNFAELSFFTSNEQLPLDNNHQERQMRNPVIGRKTWYGTHSKRGAKTAAILFTIIESCKLNKITAQDYLSAQIQNIHTNQAVQTPAQYAASQLN